VPSSSVPGESYVKGWHLSLERPGSTCSATSPSLTAFTPSPTSSLAALTHRLRPQRVPPCSRNLIHTLSSNDYTLLTTILRHHALLRPQALLLCEIILLHYRSSYFYTTLLVQPLSIYFVVQTLSIETIKRCDGLLCAATQCSKTGTTHWTALHLLLRFLRVLCPQHNRKRNEKKNPLSFIDTSA